LTITFVAIGIAVTGAVAWNNTPIKPIQILWLNLINNSLASLALATEAPGEHLLERKPRGRAESLITREMKWNIMGHAMYQFVVLIVLMFKGPEWLDIASGKESGHGSHATVHNSILFNAFIFMNMVNQINMRKMHHELNPFKGILRNRNFLVVTGIEISCQVVIMLFGGRWFKVERIEVNHWILCIVLAVIEFPVQIGIVLFRRLYDKYHKEMVVEELQIKEAKEAKRSQTRLRRAMESSNELLSNAARRLVSSRSIVRDVVEANIVKTAHMTTTSQRHHEETLIEAAIAYRASSAH
jgi:magnesium-transporting ATPase (P-type)